MIEQTLRQRILRRKASLWNERQSWFEHWRDLSDFMQPRTGRFFLQDRNRGQKRHGKIINETATRALQVLSAGLMAGMTSPARPWFRLATSDKDLMQYAPVKVWLNQCTETMRDIFSRSNTYRALHQLYGEIGCYGTAVNIVLDDFDDVIRHHNLTAGEYAISTDHRGVVTTVYREFEMQVHQIVSDFVYDKVSKTFDWSKASTTVKNLWDTNVLDAWIPILHTIEPRENRDRSSKLAKDMPFASTFLEPASNDSERILRDGGFTHFPALAPRWETAGGDIYGNSPGMLALGGTKQLQHGESRQALAVDYMVKPPLQIPVALKNQPLSTLPGGAMYVDSSGPANGIRSMFDVRLDLGAQERQIQRIEKRINETMYVDMFLMLANDDRAQPDTAREIMEKHEEKLLMLGPVLERLHNELLKPKIDLTFDRMIQTGIVPPPPEEMHGIELNVEFVSMLAQAQRAIGVGSVDRLVGTIGQIAAAKGDPGIWDKLDTDEVIDQYSDMLGVDPSLIVADDKVAIIRQQRAQQQQQMQQAAAAEQMAGAAKTASEINPDNLQEVTRQFSGYV